MGNRYFHSYFRMQKRPRVDEKQTTEKNNIKTRLCCTQNAHKRRSVWLNQSALQSIINLCI